jgi:chromosome segregation ATPase
VKNASQSLSKAQEKRLQEESQLFEVEKLKTVNPKLHLLVKKMIQADRTNFDLKNAILTAEEDRKNMRQEYSKITTALGLEDKVKRKIKEVEVQVATKRTVVENLRKKVETVQKMTTDTIDNIENSVVKEIIRKCNETRTIRAFLAEQIQGLQKEFDDLVEEIDNAEKNPKKIAPAVANQNLRTEVKSLEASITERSNLVKEREREKHQLTFHLEQSTKELVELRTKVEMLIKKQEEPKKTPVVVKSPEKKPVVKGLSQKAIEAKRDSVLEILGKGVTEGMGKEVMKVLKGVGQPGQGLASKVLELNRSQFPSKSIVSK